MKMSKQIQSLVCWVLWGMAISYSYFSVKHIREAQIPTQAHELYRKGVESLKDFRLNESLDLFGKAIEQAPNYWGALIARSHVYEIKNQYREAITDLNRVTETRPSRPSIFLKRGEIYFKKNDLEKAFQNYDAALRLNSRYYKAHLGKVHIYLSLGAFDDAEMSLKSAIKVYPQGAEMLGKQFLIRRTKQQVSTLCNAGFTYILKTQYQMAARCFDSALKIVPNSAETLFYRAIANKNNADIESALNDISMAIDLTEANYIKNQLELYRLYNQRGAFYADRGTLLLASRDFSKSIAFNNSFAESYNNRGLIFYKQEEFELACADLKHACELGFCVNYGKVLQKGHCKY